VHKFFIRILSLIIFTIIFLAIPNKAYSQINHEQIQKIFTLGRSLGISYYYFSDLSDKSQSKPYSDIKKEYNDTFQSLNIMDIILADLDVNPDSHRLLQKLSTDFYNSLQKQDLMENQLPHIKDGFITYYENLAADIHNKFSYEGSWIMALGFYSSFQMQSISSPSSSKLLLSGFSKIINSNPLILPYTVLGDLKIIADFDKTTLNDNEIKCLKESIVKITEYFGSYPENKPLFTDVNKLTGKWKGILVDPENQMHKIRLNFNNNMSGKMDIDGIAQNIMISNVKILNNYSTFMFKPFGSEKLYVKFNAKLSDNMLAGEAVDVLGQKGSWVLSKLKD